MRMPWSRRGARAAFTPFVKGWGESARPKGRTWYWYTLPLIANLRNFLWSETQPMWMWASWTSFAWLSSSTDADLKWDATLHLSLKLWSTSCRMRILFREERPPRWPPSSREFHILFHLGAHQCGDHPIKRRWWRAELNARQLHSTVRRIHWDTFGSSSQAAR